MTSMVPILHNNCVTDKKFMTRREKYFQFYSLTLEEQFANEIILDRKSAVFK